ncbi:hypothetical protein [Ahrensia sp. R2A130]|uniref:hypothetical protein n=1 Tax=Ahrensia sp. R2A130 TaxID=744979 RepID=UPI0012E9E956|nr:hypothetical protein [Ahrensia sp. R2A130]
MSYEGVELTGRPIARTMHTCRPCGCSVLIEAYIAPFIDDHTGELVPQDKKLCCAKCLTPFFTVPE